MKLQNVKLLSVLMLMLLAGLLTACATNSPPTSVQCPALLPMPPVSTPTPSQTYSASAQKDMQVWRKRLTGTQATSAP